MQPHQDKNLWVEPNGNIIIARLRGEPTEDMIRECHERILLLLKDTGRGLVLYDALEMIAPPVDVPLVQQKLIADLSGEIKPRMAIVVPNTKIAYLARLAFGEGDYRVFYNDLTAAIMWLQNSGAGTNG